MPHRPRTGKPATLKPFLPPPWDRPAGQASRSGKGTCRQSHRGQNLVELALTLPFIVLMLFFIIELGRAWFVYEGAKIAALEGAHAAAIYHSTQVGKQQLDNRLAGAGLTVVTAQVTQVPNEHAYSANVTVTFKPFFGGISIPTVSGKISIIPSQFNINYSAVQDVSVY